MMEKQNVDCEEKIISKNYFSNFLIICTFILIIFTIVFVVVYQVLEKSILKTFAISFGTTAYHFVMRLLVGFLISVIFKNNFDYKKKWFQEKSFEKKLYKKLKVKSWKDKMPTFNPFLFDLKYNSPEKIAGAMCQAEVVHTIIFVLSFLPILETIFFDSFWIFFITSFLSANFEMMFIIMQRFNRPRILKMKKR